MNNGTKRLVCIAAAPRSGNSLFAQACRAAGVNFGEDEEFRPAMPGLDPAATCEHLLIEELLEQLLSAFKQNWFGTNPFPPTWISHPVVASTHSDLANALAWSSLGNSEIWGWKNMTAARLLPLWTRLAAEQDRRLCIIVPLRNPLDVARSLKRIANLPIEQGLRLWMLHVLSIMEYADPANCRFFAYDDFLINPETTAHLLLKFLDLPATPETLARMVAVVQKDWRHIQPASPSDLEAEAGYEIAALYRHCRILAGLEDGQAPERRIKNLEDYRMAANLFNFSGSDMTPACLTGTFFFDAGDGYCPENAERRLIPSQAGFAFSETFRLPLPGTRIVAFNPSKGFPFQCKIDKIETDGEFHSIRKKTAVAENDGWDVFVPNGPLPVYELDGDFSHATYVKISGWLRPDVTE